MEFLEREAFEERHGSYELALERLQAQGNLAPLRDVRKAYADFRRAERAAEAGAETAKVDLTAVEKVADREARRSVAGDGRALSRGQFAPADRPRIDALADTYVADGAALEVLRLSELGLVYRAWAMAAMALTVTSISINSIGDRPAILIEALQGVGRPPSPWARLTCTRRRPGPSRSCSLDRRPLSSPTHRGVT
jgi:hypothetical protein